MMPLPYTIDIVYSIPLRISFFFLFFSFSFIYPHLCLFHALLYLHYTRRFMFVLGLLFYIWSIVSLARYGAPAGAIVFKYLDSE
jgi:hypothetical protein